MGDLPVLPDGWKRTVMTGNSGPDWKPAISWQEIYLPGAESIVARIHEYADGTWSVSVVEPYVLAEKGGPGK